LDLLPVLEHIFVGGPALHAKGAQDPQESVDILASTPSRLRAEVLGERKERILYDDGKTLTMFAPRVGYYASIAAPPTITQLDKLLVNEYDFSIPLRDLFVWGGAGWNSGSIENLMDVGPSQVNGTTCEQYAVRQKDIDWQICRDFHLVPAFP
jgi:hypothetical protein